VYWPISFSTRVTNIIAAKMGIAAALPHLQRQRAGHISNVSSVAGLKVRACASVYAATRHAVRALSARLRQEVKSLNIRTTVIAPGAVDTELPASVIEPDIAAIVKRDYKSVLPAASFAVVVAYSMEQPQDLDINEIVIRPKAREF
jgi:NADP-dependent 3-hydroxy acid dehydrogenase YdfG